MLHLHQHEMALFEAGNRGTVLLRARLQTTLLLLWTALLLALAVSVAQCQRTLSDAGDEDSTEYNVTLLMFTLTAALLLRLWYDCCRLRAIGSLCGGRHHARAESTVARCTRRKRESRAAVRAARRCGLRGPPCALPRRVRAVDRADVRALRPGPVKQ